ncbi:hypothetical protein [Paractinoplanes durhamensis]|uniref:Uncharacterized protein n=1 Tax=Paractinoplanes durhamensis TaxID=113563 RepID=A0ABQ3Z5A2_9ACTN|nr:hypothetical protein [Actinoplanes durhamensis]GIE04991.1 hypothetical protein Adu01nite_63410 [Actinoplanes durhamensis]
MRFLERVFATVYDSRHSQPRSSEGVRQDPVEVRIPAIPPPPLAPAVRTDVTQLLGRNLADQFTQEVCREYAMVALPGGRHCQSAELGVSLGADELGTVVAIALHFHGDNGFRPYPGTIPGRGGTIPKRGSLHAALGRPDPGQPFDQWRFPTFTMYALYAADNENLMRLTLRQ